MNVIHEFLNWAELLIRGFTATEFLFEPVVTFNGHSLTILTLLTASGLYTYLMVAIVKWFI